MLLLCELKREIGSVVLVPPGAGDVPTFAANLAVLMPRCVDDVAGLVCAGYVRHRLLLLVLSSSTTPVGEEPLPLLREPTIKDDVARGEPALTIHFTAELMRNARHHDVLAVLSWNENSG